MCELIKAFLETVGYITEFSFSLNHRLHQGSSEYRYGSLCYYTYR